jgi:hypothetical protein
MEQKAMSERFLQTVDESLNRIIMFQADVQEFRREYAELLKSHQSKSNELQAIEATAKARRAENENVQQWMVGLVEKLR